MQNSLTFLPKTDIIYFGGAEMKERVRQLRKELGLTQKQLGEAIGLKANTISDIEQGKCSVSEQSIRLICDVFNVSRAWLETGNGEIFDNSEDDKLKMLYNLLDSKDELAFKAFKAFMELDESEMKAIYKFAKKIVGEE